MHSPNAIVCAASVYTSLVHANACEYENDKDYHADNQLYISANLAQLQEIIRTSQSCISDVQAWMHNNKLQLNPDKTEMILIFSEHNQKSLSLPFCVDLNGTSYPRPESLFSATCLPHLSNLLF